MSKWKRISTNEIINNGNADKREKNFKKVIRNTKTLSYEELEKKAEVSYQEMLKNNEKLIRLYDEKKLKNKELIKKAKALKAKAVNKNK